MVVESRQSHQSRQSRQFRPRASTSGSVLFNPNRPPSHICARMLSSSLDPRPSSSSTIIIHPDEPAAIIYPKRHFIQVAIVHR
jgi:hypothetical protein